MLELSSELASVRRQLWLERAALAARLGLALGAGVLLVGEVVVRLAPATAVPTISLGLVPPVSVAVGLAWVGLCRPSLSQAARTADRRLHLREQLGTAVELARQAAPSPLAVAQIARARQAAQRAELAARRATPRSLVRVATCFGLAVGLAGLVAVTDASLAGWRRETTLGAASEVAPPSDVAGASADAASAAGVGRLDGLMQPIAGAQPTPEQLAVVQQQLGEATAQSQAAQRSLTTLAAALRQVSAGEAAAQALERGDYPTAVGSILALGQNSDQLSADARRELSAALLAAAQASPDAPLLADRERRAAEALTFPSYAPTLGALRDLAEAADRATQSILTQSELSGAWQQLESKARLSGVGPARPAVGALGTQADTAAAGTGTASAAAPPGDPSTARLESAGVPVEVPLAASTTRGAPTLAEPGAAPPDRVQVVTEPADASADGSAGAPARVAPAERNSVPAEQRRVVRDYFTAADPAP